MVVFDANSQNQQIITHKTCDQYQTIFYQGILCSQTQLAKYIGSRIMRTTNGQNMVCKGMHDLNPIDVLINPFIGKEIKDVDMKAFKHVGSCINPLNLISTCLTKFANWYQGVEVHDPEDPNESSKEDLKTYGLNVSQISIGQETDMESHYEKYKMWKNAFPNSHLILYGVSRGAATTFNALAKYQYPEVKLVILESCFNTLDDVLKNRYFSPFSSLLNCGLNLFTRYHNDGPTPAKSVAAFPQNLPVVFITSENDKFIPASSTTKLAKALASRHKNDVYLLTLKHGTHPNYMFDDKKDHDDYEAFIHAIYQRYHMPYDKALAERGESLLAGATLYRQTESEEHEYTTGTNRLLY